MSKFKRNCPKCNVELFYATKRSLGNATRNSGNCRRCSKKGDLAPSWNGVCLLTGEDAKRHRANINLKSSYGITLDDYNKMFSNQNGCCLICGVHQSKLSKSLNVDHCHSSNKIRGLLCNICNQGLGLFKDNIGNLYKAIDYLKKHI